MNEVSSDIKNASLSGRESTFDLMKGIGIISVIIGHLSDYLTIFIFSFHMPLFFIIGGYFYKPVHHTKLLKKDFQRLILPYIFTSALLLIFWLAWDLYKGETHIINRLITVIWGNGSRNHTSLYWSEVPVIGALWFLLAMFWCKQIFNHLHNTFTTFYLGCLCVALSIIAVYVDTKWINLPFALLPGISALMFFFIGFIIKQIGGFKNIPVYIVIGLFILWIYSFSFHEMSMVRCYYTNMFICILGAVGGCIALYYICDKLSNITGGGCSNCLWRTKFSDFVLSFNRFTTSI